MGKLDGKVVIVTGSSRGIGKSIAEVFAAEGGKVICAARTLKEGDHPLEGSLEHTVAGIKAAGGDATAVAVDISDYNECVRLFDEVHKIYGPVDVLVNNAALTYFIPIANYPINRWHRSFAVNVHAPFYLSQLALADMLPKKAGSIVNISSGAAIGPGRGPYTDAAARGGFQRRRQLCVGVVPGEIQVRLERRCLRALQSRRAAIGRTPLRDDRSTRRRCPRQVPPPNRRRRHRMGHRRTHTRLENPVNPRRPRPAPHQPHPTHDRSRRRTSRCVPSRHARHTTRTRETPRPILRRHVRRQVHLRHRLERTRHRR